MKACSIEDGRRLVAAARGAIASYLRDGTAGGQAPGPKTKERYGVFVTIERYPDRELRGCIGYLYGFLEVGRALAEAAVSAAFSDPRFPELTEQELDNITIEVSLLSKPESLGNTAKERLASLTIGRDGLIIGRDRNSGLLLPNVATEQGFTKEEFLKAVCDKAGLPEDSWKRGDAIVQRFETQIFREEKPDGKVLEVGWQKA